MERHEVTTIHNPEYGVRTRRIITDDGHPMAYGKKKVIFRTYQIIYYILTVLEVLLGFRMVLKILGANPYNGFTNFVYAITNPFVLPFQGIIPSSVQGYNVFEWSTIIAAVVYLLVAIGIVHLFQLIKPVTPEEVEETIDNP